MNQKNSLFVRNIYFAKYGSESLPVWLTDN
jgi:hypothetical protein